MDFRAYSQGIYLQYILFTIYISVPKFLLEITFITYNQLWIFLWWGEASKYIVWKRVENHSETFQREAAFSLAVRSLLILWDLLLSTDAGSFIINTKLLCFAGIMIYYDDLVIVVFKKYLYSIIIHRVKLLPRKCFRILT